ncbi:MAG TPA: sigma-54 dependent transcriptional regulator [Thermoanaerobaculia bacterium]|nr:sigma-54 dependent transcriptional regulator [Thermoanaerobaculia bacterium]
MGSVILIVDDDPSVVASLGLLLKRHGHATQAARTQDEALELVRREELDLVLQDMNFSRATTGREGLELLAGIRALRPSLPVILVTAWGSIALAVQGIKSGAADFVTKPWNNAQLLQAVETALSLAAARLIGRRGAGEETPGAAAPNAAAAVGDGGDGAGAERTQRAGGAPRTAAAAAAAAAAASRQELDRRLDLGGLIGRDPRFVRLLEVVGRVAPTDAAVLITGETGTGKELVAEAIHRNSRRRAGPFVKVNLGGISSTLFESEMFGHVRGAFTDARADRRGRFEMAHGGTIFLDEIGEVDPAAQVKLLRVLQDRSYEALGSSAARSVDVRVVSATNRDLAALVERGQFREDLLYRLNLIAVSLPPLRERRLDVALLARHFLDLCARAYRRGPIAITSRALAWLEAQSFPGNVRQLKQTIERAVLVLDGSSLDVPDLLALAELESREVRGTALPNPGSMTLEEMERAMIAKCMRHYEGNVTRVAEALGLSRAALYRRFDKYRIGPHGPR